MVKHTEKYYNSYISIQNWIT